MKKIIISILCFGMALLAYGQRIPSAESPSSGDEISADTNAGNSVFSVDTKHINKFMFTYNPGDIVVPEGYIVTDSGDSSSAYFMRGYTAVGLTYTHSIAVSRLPFYIEFGGGLQYLFKTSEEFKAVSVYVPVNLTYRFSFLEGKMHISPYTGFYCRINPWAKAGDEFLLGDGGYMKRAQLGWQVGASFEVKDFYFHFAYNTDVSSVLQDFKGRFRGLNVGIGIIF